MIICIHYSQVVLKGQIYSALVINNQFSAKYISIFHPQVFSKRTNLLWRKAVTSQRHSRSAWQQPLKSTLSQELHSNVQCHLWLLQEISVTLQCKLQQKLCVALQCMNVQSHRGFAWHFNKQCHRSCAWHCNTLMYNVLHGSAIHNVTQIQCDSGQICCVPPFWCDNGARVEGKERVIGKQQVFWPARHIFSWDTRNLTS